jgi:hypothetical protein
LQATKFISHIANPEKLDADSLQDLEKIRSEYPWFAAPHILLCKTHKNENRFSYQALLKKAALYTNDREVLYHFVNTEEVANPTKAKKVKSEPILLREEKETSVEEIKTREPKEVPIADVEAKKPKEKVVEVKKIETKAEPEIVEKEKKDPVQVELKEKKPTKRPPEDDQETVLEAKVEAETPEEIVPQETKEVTPPESKKVESESESKQGYNPLEALLEYVTDDNEEPTEHEIIPYSAYDPEKELQKLIDKKAKSTAKSDVSLAKTEDLGSSKDVSAEDEHSFLAWLDDLSEPEPEPKKSAIKEEVPERQKKNKTSQQGDPQKLLDQFITNRPSMRRMKKEFYSPQNMAVKSIQNNDGLVSETLAELHLKQENPLKAIEIYEQLKLQNPKNIAYFAARIQKIQNQIEKEND